MTRFTHCVLYFCETKHFSVLDRRIINEKVSIGKSVFIEFPVRKEPFEAIIKSICESKDEAEKKAKLFNDGGEDSNISEILRDEENRSCSWSPEPPPLKDEQNDSKDRRAINNNNGTATTSSNNNNNNYVTSDLFCDVMNRVVEVLQGIQKNSDKNLKECIKEMTKINQNLSGTIQDDGGTVAENEEIDETSCQDKDDATTLVTTASQTSTSSTSASTVSTTIPKQPPQKPSSNNILQQQSKLPPRPQTSNNISHGNGRITTGWPPPPPPPPPRPSQIPPEDDHTGPSWEFVSREKVDEVFEDCENYKIFARKISYAIFDLDEQKLKMNERNKKKVSELRKIIKLKYPSERREFDDMIWRNCKNAVNNTTYNEAKRRKRHSALMLGTEATAQNFLSSSNNYDATDTTPPSKKHFDVPGHQESSSAYFKVEPRSEMDL